VLWVAIHNRLHAIAFPYRLQKHLDKLSLIAICAWPLWMLVQWLRHPRWPTHWLSAPHEHVWFLAYLTMCLALAAWAVIGWIYRRSLPKTAALVSNHTTVCDVERELGVAPVQGRLAEMLVRVPGADTFRLHVNEKVLAIPGLSKPLDGLAVVHLSDLHFTGHVTRDYFEFAVKQKPTAWTATWSRSQATLSITDNSWLGCPRRLAVCGHATAST
jgi:hypothetical protein